jgi:hypothetical protein
METKFIYDLMLPYFTGADDNRPALNKVHNGKNGYLYATDGRICIRLKKEKSCKEYDEVPGFPDAESLIQKAIHRENNTKAIVETAKLIRLLAGVAWLREQDGDPCGKCNGEGVVECESCGNSINCKECDGKGITNMRIKEYSLLKCKGRYTIKMGDLIYNAEYLYIIAIFAQLLQIEEIEYLYAEKYKGSLFRFDGVDIILMPVTDEFPDVEMD